MIHFLVSPMKVREAYFVEKSRGRLTFPHFGRECACGKTVPVGFKVPLQCVKMIMIFSEWRRRIGPRPTSLGLVVDKEHVLYLFVA